MNHETIRLALHKAKRMLAFYGSHPITERHIDDALKELDKD